MPSRFSPHVAAWCDVSTSIDDIMIWLDELDFDPEYEVLTEVDIVASVVAGEEEESSDEEEVMEFSKVKLLTLQTYINAPIDYFTYSLLPEMAHHYGNLRIIREVIIKEQHMGSCQTKIISFFGPYCPLQNSAPANHSPSFLGTPPAPKNQTNINPYCSHSLITPGDDVRDADRAKLMIISNLDQAIDAVVI